MKFLHLFAVDFLLTLLANFFSAASADEEWPSLYNGVTPDSSLELAFNNSGIYNSSDATIYT